MEECRTQRNRIICFAVRNYDEKCIRNFHANRCRHRESIKMESVLSCKIASRGWHYYGKNTWKRPKKDETVFAEKERNKTALENDPYSIAWKKKKKSKIICDIVGHVPKEISRAVFYFISRNSVR